MESRDFCSANAFISIILVACASVLSATGCESRNREIGAGDSVAATVLVATETGTIGRISDMALDSGGRLYASDFLNHRVLSIDPETGSVDVLGRSGSGPTELQQPTALRHHGDSITIFDSGNGRFVTWTQQGAPLSIVPAQASAYASSASIDQDGYLVAATGGFRNGLVAVFDPSGKEVASFGTPLPLPMQFSPDDIRKELSAGEVPALFKNNVVAARIPGGAIVAALMGVPEVRRYDPDGSLAWSILVKDPVHEGLRETYARLNLEELDERVVHPYRLFADVQVEDSTFWLLGPPEADRTVIWEFSSATGAVLARYEVPGSSGVTAFVVAPNTLQVFLADNDRAQILVALFGENELNRVSSERITSR